MKNKPEQWRRIPGFPEYEISIIGEIRSYHDGRSGLTDTPHPMKICRDVHGRTVVTLSHDNKKTQRLVITLMAAAWFPENKELTPYHKNGLKDDNRYVNIGFATLSEVGRLSNRWQTRRRPVCKVDREGNVVEIYPSVTIAAERNWMGCITMVHHCQGKRKNPYCSGNYRFQYADDLKLEGSIDD